MYSMRGKKKDGIEALYAPFRETIVASIAFDPNNHHTDFGSATNAESAQRTRTRD